jgi:Transglutaminase-like superfamily
VPRGRAPLGAVERIALGAEVLSTYVRVRSALRTDNLPAVVARLRRGRRETQAQPIMLAPQEEHLLASRLAYVVSQILRRLPAESQCLTRSLVLLALLSRRGVDCAVVLGASPGSELQAHAWVEHDGRPLLPAYEPMFARLATL